MKLPSRHLSQLFEGQPVRQHRRKTIVFDCYNMTQGLNYIISGRVKVSAITESGQEFTLNTLGPGNSFPLPSYFSANAMPIYYTADTNVKSAYLPREEVDKYLHSHPEVLYDMMRDTLTLLYTRVATLSSSSAEDRVLMRLIEMADRFGTEENEIHEIIITQQELADAVSLSRESVCMILNKFEDKKLLTNKRNKILVCLKSARKYLSDSKKA